MKVLVATEKPFAGVAVDGISKVIEDAAIRSSFWKNIPTNSNCWMPRPPPMP